MFSMFLRNLSNLRFRSFKFFLRLFAFWLLIYLLYKKKFTKTSENPVAHHPGFQFIPECNCERHYFYPKEDKINKLFNSTCSDPGTFHTNQQKVISFFLTQQKLKQKGKYSEYFYVHAILENLKRIRIFYPGYTSRLYTDIVLEMGNAYCNLLCENNDLFWCDAQNSPRLGNLSGKNPSIWRSTPLGDETVDLFLSREFEAFVLKREADAVRDWLQASSKSIHVMRDGQDQPNEMLAGMWAASNSRMGLSKAVALRENILEKSNKHFGGYPVDRYILMNSIFYKKAKSILAHDSFHCEKWRHFTMLRPFPSKRFVSHNVIGYVGRDWRRRAELDKCPEECRPSFGKDWEYC